MRLPRTTLVVSLSLVLARLTLEREPQAAGQKQLAADYPGRIDYRLHLAKTHICLGNLLLDSAEVEPAKQRFEAALRSSPAVEPFFGVLAPARIVHAEYGTRCSTVLLRGPGSEMSYAERSFSPAGAEQETRRFGFPSARALAA